MERGNALTIIQPWNKSSLERVTLTANAKSWPIFGQFTGDLVREGGFSDKHFKSEKAPEIARRRKGHKGEYWEPAKGYILGVDEFDW